MAPKHHDKHRLFNQPRLISFNTISTENVFETQKPAFANFPVYQRDVLGWGYLRERRFLKNVISFDPPKVLLSIREFVLSAGNVQCLLELIITSNSGTSILPTTVEARCLDLEMV